MSFTLEEIELSLGPRKEYVLSNGDASLLREWAMLKGFHPFDVRKMSPVELCNLYHEPDAAPTEPHADMHDAIVKILEAVNAPGFEVSLTRRIARAEMQAEILSGETTKRLIRETLETLAPRQLVITSPNGQSRLDGLHHYMTETIVRIVGIGHHVMMVGPAGCGKTTIGEHAARALNLPFYITSTINDTHELTGFVDGYGKYHSTPFRQAFEHGGVWVADEIDAWDAAALLAANSALANGYANFPDRDTPIARNANFRMVATANTFGNGADRVYIGRNELDAASLDRFATVNVDYDLNLERMFANGNVKWLEHVWETRKKVNDKNIRHVVSSRAIAMGSAALAAGLQWNDVEEIYLFKGMGKSDREKLK
ncbi:ATPase domain-containing protein [Rhizobium phage RHph_X2_24]|nr:ATPase domain-containing protein [Rhizobium phage RHph_X2_24]